MDLTVLNSTRFLQLGEYNKSRSAVGCINSQIPTENPVLSIFFLNCLFDFKKRNTTGKRKKYFGKKAAFLQFDLDTVTKNSRGMKAIFSFSFHKLVTPFQR